MSKPDLKPEFSWLEKEIIETLVAGHHVYNTVSDYPESYSDMQGAVRGLLLMFEVKRRPIALENKDLYPEKLKF